jgi:hypothetical protein
VYETVPFDAANTTRVRVEDRVVPWTVTDHEVEADRPDCSNITVYVTGVHPTVFATALPCTSIDPDPGAVEKPGTDPIAYAYVPSGIVKVMALPVEIWVVPARVTVQDVPTGRPVSVKLTSYVGGGTAVKVIDVLTPTPLTVTDPEDGEAV